MKTTSLNAPRSFSRRTFLYGSALAVASLAFPSLAGCTSASAAGSSQKTADDGSRVLQVRYDITGAPMSFKDTDGSDTGADIELLRVADEYLDGYTFNFDGTTDDDAISGLSSGTYDIVVSVAFYTEDRAEKFLIPQENLGGVLVGLILRTDVAEKVQGLTGDELLEKLYDEGLRTITPQIAGDGPTYQFEQYNKRHPDKAFQFEYTSDITIRSKYYEWVAEGKYDIGYALEVNWEENVEAEDGASHQYLGQVSYVRYKALKTYPLVSKINLDEEFLAAFDEALAKAKADPRAAQIEEQFFGQNIFETYPFEEGR